MRDETRIVVHRWARRVSTAAGFVFLVSLPFDGFAVTVTAGSVCYAAHRVMEWCDGK